MHLNATDRIVTIRRQSLSVSLTLAPAHEQRQGLFGVDSGPARRFSAATLKNMTGLRKVTPRC